MPVLMCGMSWILCNLVSPDSWDHSDGLATAKKLHVVTCNFFRAVWFICCCEKWYHGRIIFLLTGFCVPHPLIFSRLNFSRLIGGRSLAGDYGNSCRERRVWKPVICPQNDPAKLLCVRFHMHACVHTTCMLVVLRTVYRNRCPPCLQACHLFLWPFTSNRL